MLATITHHLQDVCIGLRLVQIGGRWAWADIESGDLHGTLYPTRSRAIGGLSRFYCDPGFSVRYLREDGDGPALELIERVA